ncbi:343_t:CDS:2, partial [Racocetra persica]
FEKKVMLVERFLKAIARVQKTAKITRTIHPRIITTEKNSKKVIKISLSPTTAMVKDMTTKQLKKAIQKDLEELKEILPLEPSLLPDEDDSET